METILVVDDEQNIIDLLKMYLETEGFTVKTALCGVDAVDAFNQHSPDMILLDIMLPDMDGWEVCRRVRKDSIVPIIMLTAKDFTTDKVVGLELGADDYVTKPFEPRELIARIKAVLRRTKQAAEESLRGVLTYSGIEIDIDRREVKVDGREVGLTAKEFDLLAQLAAHPRIVYSREFLLENIWGYDFFGGPRTVDVHIRHLREKLQDDQAAPRFIETVRGAGYRFKGG